MNLLSIQSKFNSIAGSCSCTRIYTGSYVSTLYIEVQEYFCTKQLVYTDGGLDNSLRRLASANPQNHVHPQDGYQE